MIRGRESFPHDLGSGKDTLRADNTIRLPTRLHSPVCIPWRDWVTESMDFAATATSVDIRFSGSDYDVGLDDVGISPAGPESTPEPSSLVLSCLGALLLAHYGRRAVMSPAADVPAPVQRCDRRLRNS